MLSIEFQRRIYEDYKPDENVTTRHGGFEYTIAYNACASIHTWIIRRKGDGEWHWLQPLDKEVN